MRFLYTLPFLFAFLSCAPPSGQRIASTVSKEKKGDTYSMKLEYPQIVGAPEAFNKLLEVAALTHLEQVEDSPLPFDEYARNIATESAGQKWAFESIMKVAHLQGLTLTTLCKTYTNTGAAHPNVFHYYEVYDLTTRKRLELDDLLETGKLPALRALAKAPADSSSEPAIGLLPDHLVYRADPDARMVEDVKIPYGQLKGILKSRYIP
ncbi:MAG: hypothetical protein JNM66_01930 [Bryobacterales bacterium]|nr:hypothetical protein [Bryobacterales bacterium]